MVLISREIEIAKMMKASDDAFENKRGAFIFLKSNEGFGKSSLVKKVFPSELCKKYPKVKFLQIDCREDKIPRIDPVLKCLTNQPVKLSPIPSITNEKAKIFSIASDISLEVGHFIIENWEIFLPPTINPIIVQFINPVKNIFLNYYKDSDKNSSSVMAKILNPLPELLKKRITALSHEIAGPLVIVFDQFERASQSTIDYLNILANICKDLPVVIIFSYQTKGLDDNPDFWRSFKNSNFAVSVKEDIEISPLSKPETNLIIEKSLVDYSEICKSINPNDLKDFLYIRCSGSPKLLLDLIDRINFQGNIQQKLETITRIADKDYLDDETQIRLNTLSEGKNIVLGYGSVYGYEFNEEIINEVVKNPRKDYVNSALKDAQNLQLVSRLDWTSDSSLVENFQFSHQTVFNKCENILRDDEKKNTALRILEIANSKNIEINGKPGPIFLDPPRAMKLSLIAEKYEYYFSNCLLACDVSDKFFDGLGIKEFADRGLSLIAKLHNITISTEDPEKGFSTLLSECSKQNKNDGKFANFLIELMLYRARAAQLLDERIEGRKNRSKARDLSLAEIIFSELTNLYDDKSRIKNIQERQTPDYLLSVNDKSLKIKAYSKIGNFFYWEYFHSVRAVADEAKAAFRKLEILVQGESVDTLGKLYADALCSCGFQYQGDKCVKGLKFYEEALQLAMKYGWKDIQSTALHNIGFIYLEQNKIQEAKDSISEAIRLKGFDCPPSFNEETEIPFELGNSFATLADIELNDLLTLYHNGNPIRQFSEEMVNHTNELIFNITKYCEASIKAQKDKDDISHIINPYLTIIYLCIFLKDKTSAEEFAIEIRDMLIKHKDRKQLKDLGECLLRFGIQVPIQIPK